MKIAVLVLFILLAISLILTNLFFPKIKIKNFTVQTFWLVGLFFAVIILCLGVVSGEDLKSSFFSNSSINPLKIIILFFSMTILSIYLDEIGFFSYVAYRCALLFKKNQFLLFFGLYFVISILTIFTSNDIIILTFTPFICFLCKRSNLKAHAYLIMEFVAANTWSMCLMIGNPTNIYLASSFNLAFFDYFTAMIVPTIVASLISLLIMLLLFFKTLKEPINMSLEPVNKPDKLCLIIGLIHLISATILLAISSYISWPMWLIALAFAISLIMFDIIYSFLYKENKVFPLLKRVPWSLLPFVLSMFVIVLALVNVGISQDLSSMLKGTNLTCYSYGLSGGIIANLMNNIPMSVLYASLLQINDVKEIYASIIASNIAAYLTPLGALAGLMFVALINKYEIKFSFFDFSKYGVIIGLPTLVLTLTVLQFINE